MKKEYISPSMEIDKAEPYLLYVSSPVEEGFDPDKKPTTGETSGNLSRDFSWEEDEDEEGF